MTAASRPAAFLRTGNALAISVAAAAVYYVGARIGLEPRLPPATTPVLWPPNALLAALPLYVPPARWWSVLAGAAIVHGVVQLPVWSPDFVAAIFSPTAARALIAAVVIRLLGDSSGQFDTLRRITVLIGAR